MADAAAWTQRGPLWCLEPPGGARPHGAGPRGAGPHGAGLGEAGPGGADRLEFIGGSYLAATPQLSYRRLLEAFSLQGWSVRAWSYVPGFDHQSQANEAWRSLRRDRLQGEAAPEPGQRVLRLGHSLGCKLQLLAPDGGRGCAALAALSFNNFSAERSVPLLAEMGQQFGFRSEFSPSPQETLRQVAAEYQQPRNLLVRFRRDDLDQSPRLLEALGRRRQDASELLELPGDHLTPATAGLRRQLLGAWADDPARQRQIERLAAIISDWSRERE